MNITDYLVYLIYPILIIVLVVGMKICKKDQWNQEFMSVSQTKYLQGFTALLIMCHHMGQKTCAPWHNPAVIVHGLDIFVSYGYYMVGIFLFCSGYGLYKSVTTKENYLKGFIVRRILPLIIVFYTSSWIFLAVRIILGQKMETRELLLYISGFKFANPNSWYLIAVPLFNLIFYLCFKYIKNAKKASLCTCFLVMVYIVASTFVRHNGYWICGEWWYQSAPFFIFGIIFSQYESSIVKHIKKYYVLYLVAFFIGIFAFDYLAKWAENTFSYYYGEYSPVPVPRFQMAWRKLATLFFETLGSSSFVFFIFTCMLKVTIGNKFLAFMGKVTLEFYVIHGLFVELFGYDFADSVKSLFYIKNVALHLVIVFILSIPSAILLNKWVSVFVRQRHSSASN